MRRGKGFTPMIKRRRRRRRRLAVSSFLVRMQVIVPVIDFQRFWLPLFLALAHHRSSVVQCLALIVLSFLLSSTKTSRCCANPHNVTGSRNGLSVHWMVWENLGSVERAVESIDLSFCRFSRAWSNARPSNHRVFVVFFFLSFCWVRKVLIRVVRREGNNRVSFRGVVRINRNIIYRYGCVKFTTSRYELY